MEYRLLGRTGVKVSALSLGTMSFGSEATEAEAKAMFARCRDAGINLFDTADVYQHGESERILGRLIKPCREQVLVATKAFFPIGRDVNARGASRRHLVHSVETSLRRLNTDRIDLFYVHRFDEHTALEETMRGLDDLVRQGKVLYLGASNFAAWQFEKALGVSLRHGLSAFVALQPMYNLVKRQAEVEILPMAIEEDVAVFPYNPLGGGLLSGKYGESTRPDGGRILDVKMYQTRYGQPENFRIAERFTELARARGYHPVSLAVAWVMHHPGVTAPIIGGRNTQQIEASLDAVRIDMTEELRAEISALSPRPPPATDRNEEETEDNYGARVEKETR